MSEDVPAYESRNEIAAAALVDTLRQRLTPEQLGEIAWVLAFAMSKDLTVEDLWDAIVTVAPWVAKVREPIPVEKREPARVVAIETRRGGEITLTGQQQAAVDGARKMLRDGAREVRIGGLAGCGKALANGSKVQTPNGPVNIEDLRVGDTVFGLDTVTRVTGVFPQGVRESFKVTFRDRTSVLADADHLWSAWTIKLRQKKRPRRLLTTRQIMEKGCRLPCGLFTYSIPLCAAVNYPEQRLPIDPYVLGALIGDGTHLGVTPILCSPEVDRFIIEEFHRRLGARIEIKTQRNVGCSYHRLQEPGARRKAPDRLGAIFRRLGLNVLSPSRFIPEIFLRGSIQQRWDLLRGLMDTDGSCAKNNGASYYTKSERLARDVQVLVQSLGGTAILQRYDRREKGIDFNVNVKVMKCPFLLPRKAARWSVPVKNPPSRFIIAIEPAGEHEHTCISVDAHDGIFLTDHFIATHNTTIIRDLLSRVGTGWEVCAYTGKAANVLRTKGLDGARTIHSLIYEPEEIAGEIHFRRRNELDGVRGIIIDEASMVSIEAYDDLCSYGVPLVFVGDHGQLEPVGDDPGLMRDLDFELTEIHRNAGPIAQFAEALRMENAARVSELRREATRTAPGGGLAAGLSFSSNAMTRADEILDADQVIVAFNRVRASLNAMIRERRGYSGALPVRGERVICLKNNRDLGLFNGMQGEVTDVETETKRGGAVRHLLSFVADDGREFHRVAFAPEIFGQEYYKIDHRKGAPSPFDWAYAITCHRAQGSEWGKVVVRAARCDKWEWRRWAYTAASRAQRSLLWVE